DTTRAHSTAPAHRTLTPRTITLFVLFLFLFMLRLHATSTLFPYTTLFRSRRLRHRRGRADGRRSGQDGSSARHGPGPATRRPAGDRKSTRLNSSHVKSSYAVLCLKKKNNKQSKKSP